MASTAAADQGGTTRVGDLPQACLAHAIALTTPRDACRCAAVSPTFRAAADSGHVWRRFLPEDLGLQSLSKTTSTSKEAYLRLCDGSNAVPINGDGGCRVWLERASGAKCYALSARRLSLPWDDGEFSWRWTPHSLSRFSEVAELVTCTSLDIYGRLPAAAALTPSTPYAAYLVYDTAEGHRGLSYPDQETAVAVSGRVVARHAVCLRPDDAESCKFRGGTVGGGEGTRRPEQRKDGWWEMEIGRLYTSAARDGEQEVVASFEVLGWYPKRGLIIEGIEFRPVYTSNKNS
ncbi:F-box protein PP2-B10-like [Phragmites australis]|uniref:F-box protein PP2-B10-like n=1 Tax=Phragmites australis TaxID=29695 RepID=UPI002D788E9E|nr:F-box protein PP2-B10-like [Phragmites australis]